MKLMDVMEVLSKHREHFRVLPERVRTDLNGLIVRLDEAIDQENKAHDLGNGAQEDTKVAKRPYRKRVGGSAASEPV